MSKLLAVGEAVRLRLIKDGRWTSTGPNDPNATMGANYHYSADDMVNFLEWVYQRLKRLTPPYFLTYDRTMAEACLADTAGGLITRINSATKDAYTEEANK